MLRSRFLSVLFIVSSALGACNQSENTSAAPPEREAAYPAGEDLSAVSDEALIEDLARRTFDFFWETANPENGLVPDRYPAPPFSSVASVGFALTAYPIGIERGYVSREAARARVLTTLRFFMNAPQGDAPAGMTGYKGFFYHFLNMEFGARFSPEIELSTIDTALFLAGVLFCQSYFDGDDPREEEIRQLAEAIYARVDWTWASPNPLRVSLGWKPESGFIAYDWTGYNEAMLLYILALGAPDHAASGEAWREWAKGYADDRGSAEGVTHPMFPPLFGHQYSHAWIDFRGVADEYMREKGSEGRRLRSPAARLGGMARRGRGREAARRRQQIRAAPAAQRVRAASHAGAAAGRSHSARGRPLREFFFGRPAPGDRLLPLVLPRRARPACRGKRDRQCVE